MPQGQAFEPAWWLPGAHAQTLYPHLFRRHSAPPLHRERLELDDGDFIDLDWTGKRDGPLVMLLHGLEGSIRSHYAGGLIGSLYNCGFETVLMNFRGCSGQPNRLPRGYHSGDTGDLDSVLAHLSDRNPERPVYLVGISLGGNVLLKWLGENPAQKQVQKAVAISVPFELNTAALRLQSGTSRLYQFHLLRKLRRSIRAKARHMALPINIGNLNRLITFRQFDDQVTAPLHGFAGVDDYYRQSSSRQYIKHIRCPTLILQAINDPFLTPAAIPSAQELGPGVQLELSPDGGHVGFIAGHWPWRPVYWLDQRVCCHLGSRDMTSK
jgi:predicted alpha/beta-fold hydrolase